MDYKKKLRVCKRRIEGRNIYEIADELGVLRQSVSLFIRSLPGDGNAPQRRPNMSNDEMLVICKQYLDGVPLLLIAGSHCIDEKQLMSVFNFISMRRPRMLKSAYYPAITGWMQINGYSANALSQAIGYSTQKLINVLHGRRGEQMDYQLAEKISEFTGIPFCEIYAVQLSSASGDTQTDQTTATNKAE